MKALTRAATTGRIVTLIEDCKISDINSHVWLTETFAKLACGHPANSVGEFMPWTTVV